VGWYFPFFDELSSVHLQDREQRAKPGG